MRFTGGVSEEGAVSAGGALANLSACRLVDLLEGRKVGELAGWCRRKRCSREGV